MIKTALILILLLALCLGAFLSKPTKTEFDTYFRQSQTSTDSGLLKGIITQFSTDQYLQSVQFKDHVLWVTVEKDGLTQYTGVFSRWFKKAATAPAK